MIFRGWVVVAAVHAVLFCIFGVAYSFAAFFTAFQREFAADRGDVSLVFSICGFLYFTLGAFTGQVADRVGPRPVIATGILALVAGLVAASFATSLPALYVTYSAGVGIGVACAYVPAVGAVQPWFIRRRGVASGTAAAGIGLGTLLVPLAAVWLIEAVGWRDAFRWMAAVALVIGGVGTWFIDRDPARFGLAPDGDAALAGGAPRQAPRGITLREAFRTPVLWLQYGAITFCSIGLFIPFVHLVPYARDRGLDEATGVLLMGLIGVGSLVGRFGLAGLGDRVPRPLLLAAMYAGLGAMLLFWLASSGAFALAVFALVFGTFYGGFVALMPPLTMDWFGARNLAGIIGFLYTGAALGNLLGPWLAGVAYDLRASYTLPILVSAACMGIAFVLALASRRAPSYA